MRRLFAFAAGVGLGAAAAVAVLRSLKRASARVPEILVKESSRAAAAAGQRLSTAWQEGRRAMKEAEEELRSRMDAGHGSGG